MVEHERDEHERVAVAKAEATVVEYEVEAILDRRVRRAKLEYLVLWRGYPASQATWESECDLEGCGADHEEVEVEVQWMGPPIGSFTRGSSAPHGVSTTGYVPACVVKVCVAEVSVPGRVGVAGDEWPCCG
eukprot:COSAG06_NODE_844_length_11985_cov_4.119216_2_plen_131_part_00